jgi:tight adherence protein B
MMSLEVVLLMILGVVGLLVIGGVITFLALVRGLLNQEDVGERLQAYAVIPERGGVRETDVRRARLSRMRLRLNTMLSRLSSEKLSLQLSTANWPITETEYILIRFWAAAAGLLAGWVFSRSMIPGLGLALIAYLIPGVYLQRAIQQRRSAFERQLVDVLVLVTGAVRAGYSILQSLDIVVSEMDSPASEEFQRVRREVGLGFPLSQALNNLNARMENDDLYLVVTSININSQVGGNLTTMLEAVTHTIRERARLFGELRAMTAMQRYSAYMLTLLPIIFAGVLFIFSPDYILRLFAPGITLCFPIGAAIFILLGNILIFRMAKITI